MENYKIPAGFSRIEIKIENSRFIASAGPAFSVEEAREFIKKIRNEFSDATHNVPAFLIGSGASVTAHSSDDGEPSGTAGRPMLVVLQGSGLGDIVVVVTRYFGGIKLGTGGLVRAYTSAVQEVLAKLPLAEKRSTHTVLLETNYPLYERVKLLTLNQGGIVLDEEFTDRVLLTIQFEVQDFDPFQEKLTELSNGLLRAEVIETREDTIVPLKKAS